MNVAPRTVVAWTQIGGHHERQRDAAMIHVIGSGPAGIAAAVALTRQGLHITILDVGLSLELRDLRRNRQALRAQGFVFGRARLAVASRNPQVFPRNLDGPASTHRP